MTANTETDEIDDITDSGSLSGSGESESGGSSGGESSGSESGSGTRYIYGRVVDFSGTVRIDASSLQVSGGNADTGNAVTYTLTKEGNQIILTGSDGNTSRVTDSDTIISLPVSVENGGTGASTAAQARTNIGAAAASDLANYIPKAGGTMTGDLMLSGDPTADLQAATKKYVDDAKSAAIAAGKYTLPAATASTLGGVKVGETLSIDSSGTLNGPWFEEDPMFGIENTDTIVSPAYMKQWVTGRLSSVYKPGGSCIFADLPALSEDNLGYVYNITDEFTTTADFKEGAGKTYPAGTNVVIAWNNDAGGVATGVCYDVLAGFVDLSGYLPLAGGTMAGALTLAGDPTGARQAATKQYVDGLVGASAGTAMTDEEVIAATPY